MDHMMKEDFRDLSQPVACLLRPNVFLFDCTVTILYCIVTIYLSAIRCFAVAGPRTWNSLLIKLRQPELSLEQFTLHYIYMFSARPTTARTGPAIQVSTTMLTRGQSNLTKCASRGARSPVRGHPRGSKFVPLNSWGRGSY